MLSLRYPRVKAVLGFILVHCLAWTNAISNPNIPLLKASSPPDPSGCATQARSCQVGCSFAIGQTFWPWNFVSTVSTTALVVPVVTVYNDGVEVTDRYTRYAPDATSLGSNYYEGPFPTSAVNDITFTYPTGLVALNTLLDPTTASGCSEEHNDVQGIRSFADVPELYYLDANLTYIGDVEPTPTQPPSSVLDYVKSIPSVAALFNDTKISCCTASARPIVSTFIPQSTLTQLTAATAHPVRMTVSAAAEAATKIKRVDTPLSNIVTAQYESIIQTRASSLGQGSNPPAPPSSTGTPHPASTPPASNPPTSTPPASNPPESTTPAFAPPASTPPAASAPPASTPPESTAPASNPPASKPPASNPPASTPPASNPPASKLPASTPPASNPPASKPPASNPPESTAPASMAPASNPPASSPPASNPPASTPPASNPPASKPPASTPPASNPPASTAPASMAPASNPPASSPPESTAPASMAPASNPPASSPPASNPPASSPPASTLPAPQSPTGTPSPASIPYSSVDETKSTSAQIQHTGESGSNDLPSTVTPTGQQSPDASAGASTSTFQQGSGEAPNNDQPGKYTNSGSPPDSVPGDTAPNTSLAPALAGLKSQNPAQPERTGFQPFPAISSALVQDISSPPILSPQALTLDGQRLSPASVITIDNTPISLPTTGSALVVDGETVALGPTPTFITIGSQKIPINSQSPPQTALDSTPQALTLNGEKLSPGGVVTIDNTPVSLPTTGSALVVNGKTVPIGLTPTGVSIGSRILSITPNTLGPVPTALVLNGQTLQPGGNALTISSGVEVSLPASGTDVVLISGTSTTTEALSPAILSGLEIAPTGTAGGPASAGSSGFGNNSNGGAMAFTGGGGRAVEKRYQGLWVWETMAMLGFLLGLLWL